MKHPRWILKILSLLLVLLAPSISHARSITFQGRLNSNNSSATPVSGTVTFHTKVLTPSDAADSCVFYDEKQSATLSADGLFTINVGAGSVHGAALFTDLESGIVNSGQFAFAGSQCASGNPYPYTPAKTATRQVQISFIDPISNLEESLPPITLNPTGYAMDAGSVGGVSYTNILRIDSSGSPAANTISSTDFTKLVALIAGNSNQYAKQAASGNAVIPGHTGAFSSTPQAGEIWFDTSDQTLKYATNSSGGVAALGTAAATSVSSVTGTTGIVASPTTGAVVLSLAPIAPTAPTGSYGGSGKSASITVDQYGRVTAASEISTGAVPSSGSLGNYLKYTAGGWASAPIEVTDLKKTGDASTNLFTDTMCPANKALSLDSGTGTFKCQAIASLSTAAFDTATANAVNAAANATSANTAGAIVARDGSGNIAASGATLSSVILKDSGSNAITVKAPATSATYNFTLPSSAGSNSQVLTTDGSGNLTWGTPAPGGVVTASAPLVVTSGNIAINTANASQPGALSATDWNTFNGKQGALGFTPVNKAGDSMTGPLTLPSNGLIVGTNQLVVNGNKVGIGTATSLTTLDVAGNIKIGASAETCDASHAGMMHYNAPNLEYCDGGTSWKPLGVAGAGITSINSDTSSAHTFSTDTAGSSLGYTNSSGSHVLHIPMASATSGSAGGLISHDDYANLLPGTLAAAKILVGNGAAPSVAAPVSVSGDLTMNSAGAFTLAKIRGTDVSATSPSATGQTLRYLTGTGYVPNYIFLSDVKSSASGNANALTPACTSSQTVYWNSGTDTLACQNIGIAGSQIAAGSINPATAFTATDLVPNANLPASATYWSAATGGINYAGAGNVGIGTANPSSALSVVGDITATSRIAINDAFVGGYTFQNSGKTLLRNNLEIANGVITNGNYSAYSYLSLPSDPDGWKFYTTNTAKNAGLMRLHIGAAADVANFTVMNSNVGIGTLTPNSTLDVNGTLRLEGSSGTYSALKSPTTAGNVTWTLPAADGASGQILKTDGAGNLSFAAPTATGVTQVLTGTGLTGGPINSTGTVSLAAIANNTLLANMSGSPAAPVATTPSALLDSISNVQGSLLYRNASSWVSLPAGTSGQFLQTQGASANPQWASGNAGTVTSVALALPSMFTVAGSPVTSSGTLSATLASAGQGLVFAGPAGSSGTPSFRALASADLPASASYWSSATGGINYGGGGNVGIGTGAPTSALDVNGTLTLRGDLLTASSASAYTISSDPNASAASGSYVQLWGSTSATNTGNLLLGAGGAERVRVLASGKVGIGTSSPASQLQINGGVQIADDTATCPGTSNIKVGTLRFSSGNLQVCQTSGWLVLGSGSVGLQTKISSFASSSSTGNMSITGVGFKPTIVRFWVQSNRNGAMSTVSASGCTGAMNASGQYAYLDYANTTQVRNQMYTDRAIACTSADATAIAIQATYVSLDADGFTVNFTPTAAGWTIVYEAIGGSTTASSGSGTAGYVPIWNNTTDLGSSPLAVSGSNVGIGTTAPTATLQVVGTTSLQQQAWQTATYTNSWVDYGIGWAPASYFKDSMGVVHLRGLMKNGTVAACAFTLPAGYRPAYTSAFSVISNTSAGLCRIDVNPNGCLIPSSQCVNGYVGLDGITFLGEQ